MKGMFPVEYKDPVEEAMKGSSEEKAEIASLARKGKEALAYDILEAIESEDVYGLLHALERLIKVCHLLEKE